MALVFYKVRYDNVPICIAMFRIYSVMPQEKELSECKARKVLFCMNSGNSPEEISTLMRHSKTVIHNVIQLRKIFKAKTTCKYETDNILSKFAKFE